MFVKFKFPFLRPAPGLPTSLHTRRFFLTKSVLVAEPEQEVSRTEGCLSRGEYGYTCRDYKWAGVVARTILGPNLG
jgi:hypothetical protein